MEESERPAESETASSSVPPTDPGVLGTPAASGASSDERNLAMLAHLLGLLGWIGPLVIFLVKKDSSPFVTTHARESLNFQLSIMIGYLISAALMFVCVGVFTWIAIVIVAIVFIVQGSTAANRGELYRYPFSIRFIKGD